MPQTIIDLLNKAVEANKVDMFRRGNLIHLPAEGSLIATGDIHGHRRNFERIVAFARTWPAVTTGMSSCRKSYTEDHKMPRAAASHTDCCSTLSVTS